jgi:hypothetical protein
LLRQELRNLAPFVFRCTLFPGTGITIKAGMLHMLPGAK